MESTLSANYPVLRQNKGVLLNTFVKITVIIVDVGHTRGVLIEFPYFNSYCTVYWGMVAKFAHDIYSLIIHLQTSLKRKNI